MSKRSGVPRGLTSPQVRLDKSLECRPQKTFPIHPWHLLEKALCELPGHVPPLMMAAMAHIAIERMHTCEPDLVLIASCGKIC